MVYKALKVKKKVSSIHSFNQIHACNSYDSIGGIDGIKHQRKSLEALDYEEGMDGVSLHLADRTRFVVVKGGGAVLASEEVEPSA